MLDFYGQFVQFDASKRSGAQHYAQCPMPEHNDTNASFTVNEETGAWYCHGCSKGGYPADFIKEYYEVSGTVALKVYEVWEKKKQLIFPNWSQIEDYQKELQKRPTLLKEIMDFGITQETIEKYHIGYLDARVAIPVLSPHGQVINIRKYLPPSKRIEGSNNVKVKGVLGLNECRFYPYSSLTDFADESPIYILEGEKDVLVALSHGKRAVTSTGGTNIPKGETQYFQGKVVYIVTDNDKAGQSLAAKYFNLLRPIAKEIRWVVLPVNDVTDYYLKFGDCDIEDYVVDQDVVGTSFGDETHRDISLTKSESVECLNTWVTLQGMSVTGTDPKTYTVPDKLRVVCKDARCSRPCAINSSPKDATIIDVDPRQLVMFVDSSDNAQDSYLRKIFGCKSICAEPEHHMNVQKVLFQQTASFVDGLDDASFDHRYGIFLYEESRLMPTSKYDFEACRVTDPRTQQNYYVIRDAKAVGADDVGRCLDADALAYFQTIAGKCKSVDELLSAHYTAWQSVLGIEGRLDLFGALLLTYCSVTEIYWRSGIIKGWLDTMIIGDTRTGKSQMAQRFVKKLQVGSYINGENARRTGVIGGVQRFGDSWVITWGAIPMNDKGLLIIDEASGLEIEDIKELSATRSSGAVTINKIAKGEARARTRLIWLSNPRSGRNLEDFYWKGFGAFQEFIPVAEDQARYDLVISAAREDVDIGTIGAEPAAGSAECDVDKYAALVRYIWDLKVDSIFISPKVAEYVRESIRNFDQVLGGGPLFVGVAAHEKVLRLSCAFACLCGSLDLQTRKVTVCEMHVDYALEFLKQSFEKETLDYAGYIKEFQRAKGARENNMAYVRTQVIAYPALKVLLASNQFRGGQLREVLGIEQGEASKLISELLQRGLCRILSSGAYAPDKLLIEITKQMEV